MPTGEPPTDKPARLRSATIFLVAFLVIDVVGALVSWATGRRGNVAMFVMMGLISVGVLFWAHRSTDGGQ